jgi:hypothetical protein
MFASARQLLQNVVEISTPQDSVITQDRKQDYLRREGEASNAYKWTTSAILLFIATNTVPHCI